MNVLILGSSISAPSVRPESSGLIGSFVTSLTIDVQLDSKKVKLKIITKDRI
tara:strand:- start:90 stop:245 length:156 start_codon:yes stop_codon:yes gene_type:complete